MIQSLFKQKSTLAQLQSGPFAEHLPFVAEALHLEQYQPETIRRYVRVADRFGRWLCKQGLTVSETDETTLARYRMKTGRRQNGQLRAAGRGLARILNLLRTCLGIDEPVGVAKTEGDTLLAAFDSHLQRAAGLLPGTRSQYLRHATLFVKMLVGSAEFDITKVTPRAITDFVRAETAKLKPSACGAPSTSMRVFLRFLVTWRGLSPAVIGAVPTIRQWKHTPLPKHLSAEQVDRMLATCDQKSLVGQRDRAILLLLLRLALRAGEVGRLRLSDVDWRAGELRVYSPKSARERRLPLPTEVGESLVEYLLNRPKSALPFVFLRTRAPFSPINGSSTVSNIAKRHLKLAGIAIRGLSAHALRHTAATQMVRRGASFKQVADVLGHRRLETTNIYAKLDEHTLHSVALPWPGGQS